MHMICLRIYVIYPKKKYNCSIIRKFSNPFLVCNNFSFLFTTTETCKVGYEMGKVVGNSNH